jgi:hypothetical protein
VNQVSFLHDGKQVQSLDRGTGACNEQRGVLYSASNGRAFDPPQMGKEKR